MQKAIKDAQKSPFFNASSPNASRKRPSTSSNFFMGSSSKKSKTDVSVYLMLTQIAFGTLQMLILFSETIQMIKRRRAPDRINNKHCVRMIVIFFYFFLDKIFEKSDRVKARVY